MAVESPSSLIRQIKDVLREEAGVPACDPADPAFRGLPSFEEAISGLDPSAPPYLRCKECRGALLRGLQSTVCVFCGAEQRREGPPLGISFNSTLGCRKLLQSLDLDGSEVVALNTESKDSGKGQGTEKDALVLSRLLDIELRWPYEGKKVQCNSTNNAPTHMALNLSGVDLDSFFSEITKDVGSSADVYDEISGSDKLTDSEDFGLFEELRPMDKATISGENKPSGPDDSFGGWEAKFQSAGSQISAVDPNSEDLLRGSFPSGYANATVEEQFNVDSGMKKEDKGTVLPSNSSQIPIDDWPPDVPWHTTSTVVHSADEQFSSKSNADDGELKPNSMTDNWGQTDLWPTSSTSILGANGIAQSNDDSFDDWQDFTSLRNAPDTLSNSRTQASAAVTSTDECELGISSVDFTDGFEDMDFGSFVQSDPLPGLSDLRKDASKLDIIQSEGSGSVRMNEWEKTYTNANTLPVADKNETLSSRQSPGTAETDVQSLLSQMHDLSFMLEDNLSIPMKVEPSE